MSPYPSRKVSTEARYGEIHVNTHDRREVASRPLEPPPPAEGSVRYLPIRKVPAYCTACGEVGLRYVLEEERFENGGWNLRRPAREEFGPCIVCGGTGYSDARPAFYEETPSAAEGREILVTLLLWVPIGVLGVFFLVWR